jgi:hypothetical protein
MRWEDLTPPPRAQTFCCMKVSGDDPARGQNKPLPPAAERALAEAAERRRLQPPASGHPKEVGGQAGPEPTRFGDWENKGIASDF